MVRLSPSSFRRILLSRILLLSIPVLLVGEYVTYRKARSTLLETARQNLTESAGRKAETIDQWVNSLKSNLVGASESAVLQSGSSKSYQTLIDQLEQRLPTDVDCLQLTNLQTGKVTASTCGNQLIHSLPKNFWRQQQPQPLSLNKNLYKNSVYIALLWPQEKLQGKGGSLSLPVNGANREAVNQKTQVSLVLSAPVYIQQGGRSQLRYALSLYSALPVQTSAPKGSLAGYTVVIDQDGTILAHPNIDRLGQNIDQEADAERLKSIVRRAIGGGQAFLHLFSFEKNGVELLAGYAAVKSPLATAENDKWIVLAVTRLDYALSGLEEIQQVLLILILGLVGTSITASLYLSRDLARPLEQLRDYALTVKSLESPLMVPQNLKIREFDQLAEAIDSMVERLRSWAEELEVASEQAQVANQLKDEFLRNISHELRTPLNGIIGFLQFVRDGDCDDRDEEMEFVQRAYDAAIHLLNIINDILDIAKIESGTLSMMLEMVNLTQVIEEAVDLQAVQIEQKGLNLILPTMREEIIVYVDPDKLKQVFLNVLNNAIKFTDVGTITIDVGFESVNLNNGDDSNGNVMYSMARRNGAKDWVVVKIEDTGIGIDREQQHKLFQPFVMVDGSTTRKYEGNGLGLAISRNLMELMGGVISLYSEGINQGTTLTIALPMKRLSGGGVKENLVMENG
ncbi:two-component sensor histidine kinase [Oscillatoriales cyanobacterium USR001]|nr:two-component sensor histidine kinase [Oscillatoriales cyanobacterium USR001]